jgi:hypothetical protein
MQEGMRERYRLVCLGNSELLAGLSDLVRRSNELTGDVLAHLAELEERKLHLELGFTSTFAYCVEALGMSEGAAGRRVTGTRVCRRFPEALALIARGELHLSALCELGPHLNPENVNELFEACRRKTRRQVEHLLAARFPRPDVREQIRRLPVRAGMPGVVSDAQGSIQAQLPEPGEIRKVAGAQPEVKGLRGEAASAEIAGIPAGRGHGHGHGTGGPPASSGARRRELEALSADRFGVHFTADTELRDLIERARALASHRLPKGDLSSLMKLALTTFVNQEEKRRFAVGGKPRVAAAVGGKPREVAAVGGKPRMAAVGNKLESSAGQVEPVCSTAGEAGARTSRGHDTPPAPPGGVWAESEQPRSAADCSRMGKKRGRYVAAAVRRELYLRDHGRCSFVSAAGRRCGARAFLEFDHVEPWAALGASAADNLRLRCSAHNGLHARHCFGALHIAGKIAARRNRAQPRTASPTLYRDA